MSPVAISGAFLLLLALAGGLPSNESRRGPLRRCPRREDIHPCTCFEVAPNNDSSKVQETVMLCKGIRSSQVLQDAFKGAQGHLLDFLVIDSCKIPPFPNGLFYNVHVKWMEILNATVQFTEDFNSCSQECW